jgi:hypothetical protein
MHVGQIRLVQEASSHKLPAEGMLPPDYVVDALSGALGNEFLILEPYYLNHVMAIQLTDCNSIIVPTDEEV